MKTVVLGNVEEKLLGDKKELYYEFDESGDLLGELKRQLSKFLAESGELSNNKNFEAIRKQLELTAGECQEDVIGFIKKLMYY